MPAPHAPRARAAAAARPALAGPMRPALLAALLAALGAALVALALVAVFPARAQERTVRIGFQKYGSLALLRGRGDVEPRLTALGHRVVWSEFPSGPPLMEAINAGAIDIGTAGETPPIFAQAAADAFLDVGHEPPSPAGEAILVGPDSALRGVGELKGRKVAVTKGAGSHHLLLAALAAEGLGLKDVSPAYLTPADGRGALAGGSVDAWVAWDPFLSAAQRQTGARILRDGVGLSAYKLYSLATDAYTVRRPDVLAVPVARLREAGAWVKAEPETAAERLSALWKLDPAVVLQANARRSYRVEPVTRAGLVEQQRIADAFRVERLLPRPVEADALPIWEPPSR